MYPREQLEQWLDTALEHGVTNVAVVKLMEELDQIPVKFNGDTIEPDDLPKYLDNKEIFTDNPYYKQTTNNFSIYDENGKLLLMVSLSGGMRGYANAKSFTVPLSHPEDKEALLDFCDRIQRMSAVKYPDISE